MGGGYAFSARLKPQSRRALTHRLLALGLFLAQQATNRASVEPTAHHLRTAPQVDHERGFSVALQRGDRSDVDDR